MAERGSCGLCLWFKRHTPDDLATIIALVVIDMEAVTKDGFCTLEPTWLPVTALHYCSHYQYDLYKDESL